MSGWIARALVLGLLSLPLELVAAINHDVTLHWLTLRSAHFTLHYSQHNEASAREMLAIAEAVHTRLTALMAWQPQGPTEIVLTDEYDDANGNATPYPANRMTIYLSAPDALEGLEDHAGWLEMVFTHEYAHILHLDKATGSPAALRRIFGRHFLLFPNMLQPSWFIEGLATHEETDRQRGIGRGQSSYFEMLMRMEVLGGFKPLREVNQPLTSWPMGTVPYLYGVNFYDWLAQQYGEQTVLALVNNYSSNIVPFRIDSNASEVTGKDLDALWNDFAATMQARYRSQADAIAARGLSPAQRLTRDGYFAQSLVAGAGQDVYYVGFDAMHRPALMRLRNDKAERLAEVTLEARLAFHPQQKLLVAQPEVCRNADLYYDLYRFDENGGGRTRLTQCARYRLAIWSPDGQSILAVHNENGFNELHLLDAQGHLQKKLWRGEQREVIGSLDWSPQSGQIAAALWQPGQGWDLALFDAERGEWHSLTRTTAIEHQAKFASDGHHLLFSADYDGVYNLHTLDIASGRIETLSNVLGGAFFPVQVGDEVIYAGYSAEGFDLYRQPYQPRPEPVAITEGSGAIAAPPYPEVAVSGPSDYSPWESVQPRWWFPHLLLDSSRSEMGVATGGSDTLNRHLYAVDAAYDAKNHWGVGSLDYVYDRWTPLLELHADTLSNSIRDDNGHLLRIRRETSALAEVVTPLLHYYSQWAVHAGVVEEHASDGVVASAANAAPDSRDRLAGVALAYNSASAMPRSVSRADGRELLLVAEDSSLLKGSDWSGRATTLDWKEFIRLGGEHVLALRGVAAKGDEGIRPFNLGGIAKPNTLPMLLDTSLANAPFNRRTYALRGYDEGLPQLTGTQMRLASLEYRFPIHRVERGYMAPPIGLHQLHGALFAETGAAWTRESLPERYYSSYGAELNADTVLFYGLPLQVTAGFAHGMSVIGGDHFYLRLGASF